MRLLLVGLVVVISACTSAQKSAPEKKTGIPTASSMGPQIDYNGLQRSLGLDRSRFDLGYQEKSFNSCEAGFGYNKDNCRLQFFTVINFRLQCRDTVGTTSEVVTSAQLQPIAKKLVRFKIGEFESSTPSDEDGYGQIRAILNRSARGERLKLAVGNQFVYTRASEVTRLVTPADWCW